MPTANISECYGKWWFAFTWQNGNSQTNACLVYNWTKKNKDQNYKDSKFHLVWTISKRDQGVAVYLTATVKDSQKMEFEGYSYIFEKSEENWKAIKKLGLKDGSGKKMILEKNDWKAKFPKRGNTQDSKFIKKTDQQNDHYWVFLNSNGDNVQDLGNTGETNRNLWWKWKPNENGIYFLQNWSDNFDTWWTHFFGKDKLDMAKLMGNNQGSWE